MLNIRPNAHLIGINSENSTFKIPRPMLTRPAHPEVPVEPASMVNISEAGRNALAQATGANKKANELRELLQQYDFHHISPRQLANLAGELVKQGEMSREAPNAFIGVELDTLIPMDPDQPIDMVAHFKMMLDSIEAAAATDPTLDYALAHRRQASQVLADVMSFANSSRLHLSTSTA